MNKKLYKLITNAQTIIEQESYKCHSALKAGWQYPSLPNGYNLACIRFNGSSRELDLLYISEDGAEIYYASQNRHHSVEIEYPWLDGYIASRGDWESIGFIVMGAAPTSFIEKPAERRKRLAWTGINKVDIHPRRHETNINCIVQILNAIKTEAHKNHPNVKANWSYPDIPDGYNMACARVVSGSGLNNVYAGFSSSDLSLYHDDKEINVFNSPDCGIQIAYPWVDGYKPTPQDWISIGFGWGVICRDDVNKTQGDCGWA